MLYVSGDGGLKRYVLSDIWKYNLELLLEENIKVFIIPEEYNVETVSIFAEIMKRLFDVITSIE